MKLHCPRCEKKLSIPDKFAGKNIRCPACNRAFQVPTPKVAVSGPGGDGGLDLEGLAALERRSTQLDAEELAAQPAQRSHRASAKAGERTCPQCGKITPVPDEFVEVLCSHCWTPIPGTSKNDAYEMGDIKLVGYKGSVTKGSTNFYNGLATAMGYPSQAAASLLLAIAIAIAIILVPSALGIAIARATTYSDVGSAGGPKDADLSGVQIFIRVLFAVEVVFFSAVGVHAFLDVVRTTAVGQEQPPSLVWNPTSWGKSIVAYVCLLGYYIVMTYVVVFIARGHTEIPASLDEAIKILKEQNVIIGLVVISSIVPMNLIGLSLGEISQGLNPVNVVKSIGKTHVHYLFLVIMLCVYGSLCLAAFVAILKWFIPELDNMARGAGAGDIAPIALGLVAWGLVMGFVLYAVYALGRLHGLFARSYRKKLMFGEA